jgi:enterochelin esterase-like enzyme/uncharacterized protein YggT (Ycf19 family)
MKAYKSIPHPQSKQKWSQHWFILLNSIIIISCLIVTGILVSAFHYSMEKNSARSSIFEAVDSVTNSLLHPFKVHSNLPTNAMDFSFPKQGELKLEKEQLEYLVSPKADSGKTTIELEWLYSVNLGHKAPVYFVLPPSYHKEPQRRYPMVILLGGASAIKDGLLFSARYWTDRCNIQRILRILYTGETERPFSWVLSPTQKARLDQILAKAPMAETIYVCPHTYNGIYDRYLNYISEELLTYTESHYRTIPDRAFRGIDGACLGGALALYIAFWKPHLFASVGGLQPDIPDFGYAIEEQLQANFNVIQPSMKINTNTGYADVYRWSIERFAKKYKERGLDIRQYTYRGSHDYSFYRNQGGYDTFLFHSANFQQAFAERSLLKAPEFLTILQTFLILPQSAE